ncbi:hypothetical protein EPN87_00770 [archaeon]|nr:MAG: hypothetical protein EPN87_00770 [archaeon]
MRQLLKLRKDYQSHLAPPPLVRYIRDGKDNLERLDNIKNDLAKYGVMLSGNICRKPISHIEWKDDALSIYMGKGLIWYTYRNDKNGYVWISSRPTKNKDKLTEELSPRSIYLAKC